MSIQYHGHKIVRTTSTPKIICFVQKMKTCNTICKVTERETKPLNNNSNFVLCLTCGACCLSCLLEMCYSNWISMCSKCFSARCHPCCCQNELISYWFMFAFLQNNKTLCACLRFLYTGYLHVMATPEILLLKK